MLLQALNVSDKGFAGIRVLRAFRVLRLFKVFKYIKVQALAWHVMFLRVSLATRTNNSSNLCDLLCDPPSNGVAVSDN